MNSITQELKYNRSIVKCIKKWSYNSIRKQIKTSTYKSKCLYRVGNKINKEL